MRAIRVLLLMALTLLLLRVNSVESIPPTASALSIGSLPEMSLQASGPITATLSLPGLPVESMLDAANRLVVTHGLENVAVGTHVLLEGGGARGIQPEAISAYAWTLHAPSGSSAVLDQPTSQHPFFIPDKVGTFIVELAVANRQGAFGPTTSLTITAGTWVGAGIVPGGSENPAQCINCHKDLVTSWRQTRHAASLSRAIDGHISEHYFENCIYCHTVGYDKAANNNGFDDVAREMGWTYPKTLAVGNWDDLAANYPRLANLGNTQCESCHGPGSQKGDSANGIAISLRPDLCGTCHDPLRQDLYPQWRRSRHSNTGLAGNSDPRCAACHTAEGAIASWSKKKVAGGGMEAVTCAVCHDPHERSNEYELRVFDTVTLPDGVQLTQAGSSALCMACHNAVERAAVVRQDGPFYPPHNAAAEMLAGAGGYDYGETIYDSPHARNSKWKSPCIDCHMGLPESAWAKADAESITASMNRPVGGHTFKVKWDGGTPNDPRDDVENVKVCEACHGKIPRLNGPAAGDYDGDRKVENVQDEVQGLLNLVKARIIAAGIEWKDKAPDWGLAKTEAQKAAVYNWSFVANDRSGGLHNLGRAVQLLQITYRRLTGQDVPGATLWADAHSPSPYATRFVSVSRIVAVLASAIGVTLVVLAVVYLNLRSRKKQKEKL